MNFEPSVVVIVILPDICASDIKPPFAVDEADESVVFPASYVHTVFVSDAKPVTLPKLPSTDVVNIYVTLGVVVVLDKIKVPSVSKVAVIPAFVNAFIASFRDIPLPKFTVAEYPSEPSIKTLP